MFQQLRARLFTGRQSHTTAKNRLQMVLVQDRSGLTTDEMDLFKKDLLDVLSRYFVIEKGNLEIEWQRNDLSTTLIINTPVVGRSRTAPSKAAAAGNS